MATPSKRFRLKFMFQQVDLHPGRFAIGRSPTCNLTLEDVLVSRTHAVISVKNDTAYLSDEGSRNGTRVNDMPLTGTVLLRNNDRIRLGAHELVFLVEDDAAPSGDTRATGALIKCRACKSNIAFGTANCPHCGTHLPLRQDNRCQICNALLESNQKPCPICESNTPHTAMTETSSRKWSISLGLSVIKKAIATHNYAQADKTFSALAGHNRTIDDATQLAQLSAYALILGEQLNHPDKLRWVLMAWRHLGKLPPPDISKKLESLVSQKAFSELRTLLGHAIQNGDPTEAVSHTARHGNRNERV